MSEKNPVLASEKEKVVRILSENIEGGMKFYAGLTKIKGISWGTSNVICKKLKIDRNRRVGSLNPEEIKRISDFIKNLNAPDFICNRRNDFESGKNMHLTGSTLELQKDFDIKRLKKIKSYKGIRHGAGLPLRGQRTKGHFRKNKMKGVGIKKKSKKQQKGSKNETKT